ncbi:MAG: type II toxin-antitoxin system VapC family toxin [Candidatus Dormibacteria bacterium]
MPDDSSYYWDSCVFLAWINGEPDRVDTVDSLLRDAGKGSVTIYTSVLTSVEVAFGADEKLGGLDAEVARKIANLWLPSSPIKVIECHPIIANGAVDLIRDGLHDGWSLKPMDALHLSSAQRQGVTAFHTYDLAKLARFSAAIGMPIEAPPDPAQRTLF